MFILLPRFNTSKTQIKITQLNETTKWLIEMGQLIQLDLENLNKLKTSKLDRSKTGIKIMSKLKR